MKASNFNYMYNVEYFNEIFRAKDKKIKEEELKKKIDQLNLELMHHKFEPLSQIETLSEINNFHSFDLYTTYPGLLIGLGYPHDISEAGAVKTGLSLDYVSGVPYLPGSYLKGQIHSWFPDDNKDDEKAELIHSFLGEKYAELDVIELRDWIFVNNVVFLGGFIVSSKAVAPLAMDYITPHNKGKFKNPVPINMLRIKPGIQIRFCFAIPDYTEPNINAKQIESLFKKIIIFGGIGAKTNTGYGRMVEYH